MQSPNLPCQPPSTKNNPSPSSVWKSLPTSPSAKMHLALTTHPHSSNRQRPHHLSVAKETLQSTTESLLSRLKPPRTSQYFPRRHLSRPRTPDRVDRVLLLNTTTRAENLSSHDAYQVPSTVTETSEEITVLAVAKRFLSSIQLHVFGHDQAPASTYACNTARSSCGTCIPHPSTKTPPTSDDRA